jgi:uncharacterized protein YjdB
MQFQAETNQSNAERSLDNSASKLSIFTLALLTCAAAVADPVPQFGVTAVNAQGNSLYNVTLTPNATPNTGALITGTTRLNTTSEAATHGKFFAVVRVPNSVTSALDLIVADSSSYKIVRYAGPGPTYQPSTTIFTYTRSGSGPNRTTGLAVDVAGNVFAASAGVPSDSKPALWVLPFNKTTGAYGAPVLIDNIFGGVKNCGSIDEVVVASAAASPRGAAAPAWKQGDVLVLINAGSGGATVLVYSQAAIAGVLNKPSVPLSGPTSVLISSFSGEKPTGIDVWPADATFPASGHGVSLVVPMTDGRVMRFDSSTGGFTTDFANGLGAGLLKIKVGTYSTFPYAFIAQSVPGTGRILQFGAPPASGANNPLSSVSTGVNNPQGLAVTSSSSEPVGDCAFPNACAPLGAQLTTQIATGNQNPPNLNPNNPLLEESCVVNADPRVTASVAAGTWSCAGGTIDIANFCPGFPSTVMPGSMCGHSGPTGAGFVVVKSTAKAVDQDPNINNSFILNTVDPDLPLPGLLNLTCPHVPMFAWAPRSDLPLVEGTIPEGNTFIDLSSFCDRSGGTSHVLSMIAYGLGLNSVVAPNSLPTGLVGFVTDKFTNLTTTITNAAGQINDGGTTQGLVNQARTYFLAGVANTDANAHGCAMNALASADAYVRGTPSAFTGAPPPGNPNPAGDIDGRLGNLFMDIDVYFLFQSPNTSWPTSDVPPCMTFTATPATGIAGPTTVIAGGTAQLAWSSGAGPYPAASCTLSANDGTFTNPVTFTAVAPTSGPFIGVTAANGLVSTGTLNNAGTYSAQLVCLNGATSSIKSLVLTTVNVIQLSSISVGPAAPSIAAGATQQLAATGTYTDNSTKDLTSTAIWTTSADPSIATVSSGGLVTCLSTASAATPVLITATSGTVTGSVTVMCLAPTLNSITVSPSTLTLAAGSTAQLTATANYSYGSPPTLFTWTSDTPSVATVSSVGLVSCVAGGSAKITVTSGSFSASTTVTCQAAAIKYIFVTSKWLGEIPNGGTRQLTATAIYAFGLPQDVTGKATWNSSAPSVATVSAGGLVSCKRRTSYFDGLATIYATIGNTTGWIYVVCDGLGS